MSQKGSDADPMGFWVKTVIFGRRFQDYLGCRPVICISNRQSVHRRATLKLSDALPIVSIVETSTGNLVLPV